MRRATLALLTTACLAFGVSHTAQGQSALHDAIDHEDIDAFVGLLQAGHDPNEVDSHRRTALHAVVVRMQDDGFVFANEAIRYGADLEARDNTGVTPLFYAAVTGSIAIASELIRQGADVHTTSPGGENPVIYHAYLTGHLGIAKLLEDHGAFVVNRDRFLTLGISEKVERDLRRRSGKYHPEINETWARKRLLYYREKYNLKSERLMSDDLIDDIVQTAYENDPPVSE